MRPYRITESDIKRIIVQELSNKIKIPNDCPFVKKIIGSSPSSDEIIELYNYVFRKKTPKIIGWYNGYFYSNQNDEIKKDDLISFLEKYLS